MNLVKTKHAKIEVQETTEHYDYARLFNVANEVLRGIRAGVFIPNRGGWLCAKCELEADCREWAGN